MVPDVALGDREQDVANQLPLRGAFGYGDIQECGVDVGDVLDDQWEQGHEAADEQEANLLCFAGAEPGHAQGNEHDNGDVGAGQGERAEEGGDWGEGGHVNAERKGDEGGQTEAHGDPQPGGIDAANQALLHVQRDKGPQDLHRAGQDEGLHDTVGWLAASQEPPDHQHCADRQAGQAQGFGGRQLAADVQARQAHYQRQGGDEGQGKDEEFHRSAYEPPSRGKTFTSTRRFFLLCSALLGSVQPGRGLSQPLPTGSPLF